MGIPQKDEQFALDRCQSEQAAMGCAATKHDQLRKSRSLTQMLNSSRPVMVDGWQSALSRDNTSPEDAQLSGSTAPQTLIKADVHRNVLAERQLIADSTVARKLPAVAARKQAGNKTFATHGPALMAAARMHQSNATICEVESTSPYQDEADVLATEACRVCMGYAPEESNPLNFSDVAHKANATQQFEHEAQVLASEKCRVRMDVATKRLCTLKCRDVMPKTNAAKQFEDDANMLVTEPCPLCTDVSTESLIKLTCGHVAHKACLEAMISARWTGKRITFNYMKCFMCRHELEHPELLSILAPHKELRRKVMNISVSACNKEGISDNLNVLMEESPEQTEAAAAAEIACFECTQCGEPYAAGRVDCGVEEETDMSTLQCADCQWKNPSEHKCSAHGAEHAIIKCDWCCNIAMFKCGWGMFCNDCHKYPSANLQPLHDPNGNERRKKGQGQHCPGPDKCPLRMPHPPNGTAHRAFVIGCSGCVCDGLINCWPV